MPVDPEFGPVIVTAWRSASDGSHALGCPLCRTWSPVDRHAVGTVLPCPGCSAALRLNPFLIEGNWRLAARSWEGPNGGTQASTPNRRDELEEWSRVLKGQSHVLRESPSLLYQTSANQPDATAPAREAAARMRAGLERRPWLRRVNKAQHRDPCLLTLAGHQGGVQACGVSADGRWIISASMDHTLKLWDAATGQELVAFRGHQERVMGCALSPDRRRLGSVSWDGTVCLWDTESGRTIATLRGQKYGCACAFSPDGSRFLSGASDWTLVVSDAASGRRLLGLVDHPGYLMACSFSPDGRRILSATMEKTVKLWDAESGEALATRRHRDGVRACGFSPDGRFIVSASEDRTLRLWQTGSSRSPAALEGHSDAVLCCAFSPDGTRIVSGSRDRSLIVWDVKTRKAIVTLAGHAGPVWACGFSADGGSVISGSDDGTLALWDPTTGRLLTTLVGHQQGVTGLAVSPLGFLISASSDTRLKLWDLATAREAGAPIARHTGPVKACCYLPNGQQIVSASEDSTVRVWQAATGQAVTTLTGHGHAVETIAVSPDSSRIVSGSRDGTLKLWDAQSGEEQGTLRGHTRPVEACRYSRDGRRIASAAGDEVKEWDSSTGAELRALAAKAQNHWANACEYSPDGHRLVSASDSFAHLAFALWNTDTGQLVAGVPRGRKPFAFSPDGQRVMLAGSGELLVCDAGTGSVSSFARPAGVTALAYSPDGRWVATGSARAAYSIAIGGPVHYHGANLIELWDAETGRAARTMRGHASPLRYCVFSPDSGRLVSVSEPDGVLIVWEARSGAKLAEARVGSVTAPVFSPDGHSLAMGTSAGELILLRLEGGIGP